MLVCGPSTVEDTHEAVRVVVTSSFANEKEISVLVLNATTGTHTVSTGTHTHMSQKPTKTAQSEWHFLFPEASKAYISMDLFFPVVQNITHTHAHTLGPGE